MKIFFLTTPHHMYATFIVNEVINKLKGRGHLEIRIISSGVIIDGLSFSNSLLKLWTAGGTRYLANMLFRSLVFRVLSCPIFPGRFSEWRRCMKQRSPVVIKDINSAESYRLFRTEKPDLAISVFFNQIIREPVLSEVGEFWNLHPSLLPKYRGVHPVFWAMADGDELTGITLHKLSDCVDKGDIISQESERICPNDTEDTVLWRLCETGAAMVAENITRLIEKGKVEAAPQGDGGWYRSWPSREDMEVFFRKGNRFFRLKDLIKRCYA